MKVLKAIITRIIGVLGAAALTLALFLVLPLMQAIGEKDPDTYVLDDMNIAYEQPPPDVVEEEEPPPEDVEDPPDPPEIDIDEPMMTDITQLDALGGTGGFSIPGADTTINIDSAIGGKSDLDQMFDPGSLDQPARVLFQAQPKMTADLRRRAPATVVVVFIVDARGRVQNASVQASSDPSFNTAALNAVKQWRFEPGQSKGKPVESRMRIPITFPKE